MNVWESGYRVVGSHEAEDKSPVAALGAKHSATAETVGEAVHPFNRMYNQLRRPQEAPGRNVPIESLLEIAHFAHGTGRAEQTTNLGQAAWGYVA